MRWVEILFLPPSIRVSLASFPSGIDSRIIFVIKKCGKENPKGLPQGGTCMLGRARGEVHEGESEWGLAFWWSVGWNLGAATGTWKGLL